MWPGFRNLLWTANLRRIGTVCWECKPCYKKERSCNVALYYLFSKWIIISHSTLNTGHGETMECKLQNVKQQNNELENETCILWISTAEMKKYINVQKILVCNVLAAQVKYTQNFTLFLLKTVYFGFSSLAFWRVVMPFFLVIFTTNWWFFGKFPNTFYNCNLRAFVGWHLFWQELCL